MGRRYNQAANFIFNSVCLACRFAFAVAVRTCLSHLLCLRAGFCWLFVCGAVLHVVVFVLSAFAAFAVVHNLHSELNSAILIRVQGLTVAAGDESQSLGHLP